MILLNYYDYHIIYFMLLLLLLYFFYYILLYYFDYYIMHSYIAIHFLSMSFSYEYFSKKSVKHPSLRYVELSSVQKKVFFFHD